MQLDNHFPASMSAAAVMLLKVRCSLIVASAAGVARALMSPMLKHVLASDMFCWHVAVCYSVLLWLQLTTPPASVVVCSGLHGLLIS
jgi:hypothetical protein